MANRVDVLIQPFTLRFSLYEDEIVYMVAGTAEMQLDRMELLMGVDPATQQLFDSNVGFLPVATTTLIRGEKTIVVDPGNHHVGFYGPLRKSLSRFQLTPEEVDLVVCTHAHGDHMASISIFSGTDLIIGERELAQDDSGEIADPVTRAQIGQMGNVTEVPYDGELEIMSGVKAISTPGHSPGHISVLVDCGEDRVAIAGDTVMFRREYDEQVFGHWYSDEQRRQLNDGVEKIKAWSPTKVLPGHDRAFPTGERRS
jgi:N-acyl homoserine lactone hydrolase